MIPPKKILVVTPRFPYPEAGADEQDRASGIRQLVRLGHQVRVVAKYFDWQDADHIAAAWAKEGVSVELVPYRFQKKGVHKLERFWLYARTLDGSTIEYAEAEMQKRVATELAQHQPDLVWFDYTYLSPLYNLVKRKNIPIIVRSINFEPAHYWDENKRSILRIFKYLPKLITEHKTIRRADRLFAITPQEALKYGRLLKDKAKIRILPLRSLPEKIGIHAPRETKTLHVFFVGSTFSVEHNLRALNFISKELATALGNKFGDTVHLHIFGAKVPVGNTSDKLRNVSYEGFAPDLKAVLQNMDIALAPSFFGAGMQQKIFEPLARGFPTITHARALAGYDFIPGQEVLLAETVPEFCDAIAQLFNYSFRAKLGAAAGEKARALFNQNKLDDIVSGGIEECVNKARNK